MNYGTEDAINFLLGKGTDGKGRTVIEYFGFTTEKWEECHDHIQWAFPTDIPSEFNSNAPVIDLEELMAYRFKSSLERATLVSKFIALYNAYFHSIGFDSRLRHHAYAWRNDIRTPNNHNFRRISRLMRSCAIMRLLLTVNNCNRHLLDTIPDPMKIRDYLFTNFIPQSDHILSDSTVYHWYTSAAQIITLIDKIKESKNV